MVVFRLSLRLLVASALFVMGADNAHAYLTPGDSFGVPSADQAVDDIPVIPSIDTLEPQVQDPAHDPPFPVGTGGGGGPTRGSQDPNLVKTLNSTNRAGAENSAPSEKNQETNGGTHNASPENTQTMPQSGIGMTNISIVSLACSFIFFLIKKKRFNRFSPVL